ncbi:MULTISPECIES: hypothetical protein [Emticicia]|uniref:hypothetical protein n=1 Tax=Emticicia TaxID=312278 RepID=UPI0007D8C3AE|nr:MULTISPECIES: hypothetical protein [Emticicia]
MFIKQQRAFKYFEIELKSLVSFLIVTNPYVKDLSSSNFWEQENLKTEKSRIQSKLTFEPVTKEFIVRSFDQNIPFLSRELIYIRIISALEIFLVQSVRDIFKQTTKPFLNNKKIIDLNYSQILELTTVRELRNILLQKETRPLSSAGYEDVVKYYKQQLGIDISSLGPGINKMSYYHQIRHILVHRLGKADKYFKKKYSFTKTYIQIDEELLINLFNDVYNYANQVSQKVKALIDAHSSINVYRKFKGERFRIEFDSQISDKVNFLEPEYHFWVGDEIYYVEDLGLHIISKGSHYKVEVWGEPEILKAYKRSIKTRLTTSKYFENINIFPVAHPKVFDESIILAVSKLLPDGIWPRDIRKEIAAELNISNNIVDKIINKLNERGMHLKPE